jgi:hypothetical protein
MFRSALSIGEESDIARPLMMEFDNVEILTQVGTSSSKKHCYPVV